MTIHQYNHQRGSIPDSLFRIPLFARLRRDCLEAILDHVSILTFRMGDSVVEEGTHSHGFFVLLKGELQVMREGNVVATLEQTGDLFGELSYVLNQPHGASVRASRASKALKIDGSIKRCLSDENALHFDNVMYRYLTELLATRLQRASTQVASSTSTYSL